MGLTQRDQPQHAPPHHDVWVGIAWLGWSARAAWVLSTPASPVASLVKEPCTSPILLVAGWALSLDVELLKCRQSCRDDTNFPFRVSGALPFMAALGRHVLYGYITDSSRNRYNESRRDSVSVCSQSSSARSVAEFAFWRSRHQQKAERDLRN